MSDTTSEAAATDAEDTAPAETPDPATDPAAEVEKWKTLARKNEARAKENAAAARRLQEIEDAAKTEQQRLEERAAAAERERDETRAELTRLRVAARHGIGEEDLDLLGSGTDEEIEARARRLAERFAAPAAAAVPGRPVEAARLRSAAADADAPAPDGNDWFRRFVGAQH